MNGSSFAIFGSALLGLASFVSKKPKGILMAIGGAEDRSLDSVILSRFFELSGGIRSKIVIIPIASSELDAGFDYAKLFRSMGSSSVKIIKDTSNRISDLSQATGILFTGGDQSNLERKVNGTPMELAIKKSYQSGAVIAGSSAGAAYLSDTMITGGSDVPATGFGLGLIKGIIFDQHFTNRNREGRLNFLIRKNPDMTGYGVDENSAIIIHPNGHLETIGSVHKITYANLNGSRNEKNFYDHLRAGGFIDANALQGSPLFNQVGRVAADEDAFVMTFSGSKCGVVVNIVPKLMSVYYISVIKVIGDKSCYRQGFSNHAFKAICEVADHLGVKLLIYPMPFGDIQNGPNFLELRNWYSSLGFEPLNKDEENSIFMIRKPNSKDEK
jgi:cyanophycinase